ncbi:uncharacterized protein LOC105425882 [Pogonomyrmex barbatus]|uniref:Uncharacterized protein LOC105425882 n=1 Tax=Pogonomyrmex barbatus TaxID=144034 RepID=A0A8N1S6V7_9HYME|nr:uncharacterized protein LOC105425882 [Pogonomyrmex barbatus]
MICDTRTCSECQYLEQDEPDDRTASFVEFLANCQHAKCKVVRLVRQQISKLQNVQHEHFLTVSNARDGAREWMHETPSKIKYDLPDNNEVHEVYGEVYEMEGRVVQRASNNELYGKPYETQQVAARRIDEVTNANAATASLHRAASPERAVDRKWMLRILDRVRHRAHLILAAAAVGVIVWTALVYGVFLGATACGSGRTCFRSSLRHTHAKRTLF